MQRALILKDAFMTTLNQQFIDLSNITRELLGLLREAEEPFWVMCFERALPKVDAHELAGATLILGCYGGMDTFSDLEIGKALVGSDPLSHRNLNSRLDHLRTQTFEAARRIAARQTW
ncbi:MAG: hypothetical protein CBC94_005445 [Gammaproteobacteria bacterium TMED134]|jgi:hypothetical protein|nr:MAG: hypothetical protein CBC94_006380 [Gammaproteobacteria bacterium TMED134]RPG46865.1 MAG: hypothetical protein CBC94_005445 [Gammaproteobacteria bacterium TMED134]|tara:strand:+ start:31 stop:384 length:354 start_codon:yes stop_codon:yes gene_type:complete